MNRALANVRYLSKRHRVTVLTEMPNHPKGVIFDGYKRKLFLTERMESFTVKRLWVWTSRRKNFFTRILFYLTFAVFGTLYTLFNARKFDFIYMTSPPLFVSLIGIVTKTLRPETRIIFEVRDLWPDSAIEMGELRSKIFIKLSLSMEKAIYKKSEQVVAVTRHIKKVIESKGIPEKKIQVIYNGIEPEKSSLERTMPVDIMEREKKAGNFIVLYAGILGLAQNLSTLIQAASLTANQRVSFFIIGAGPKEPELKREAAGLKNVFFPGEISHNMIHNYLLSADCGVVPLAKLPIFKGAIPSKLFEYMISGLPVLLGIEGEAASILKEANAGLTFIPDDSKDLADKILFLKNNPDQLKEYSLTGKDYALKHFNRTKQAELLEKTIIQLTTKSFNFC